MVSGDKHQNHSWDQMGTCVQFLILVVALLDLGGIIFFADSIFIISLFGLGECLWYSCPQSPWEGHLTSVEYIFKYPLAPLRWGDPPRTAGRLPLSLPHSVLRRHGIRQQEWWRGMNLAKSLCLSTNLETTWTHYLMDCVFRASQS